MCCSMYGGLRPGYGLMARLDRKQGLLRNGQACLQVATYTVASSAVVTRSILRLGIPHYFSP